MNPETKGGQPDKHLYLEQISPSWETFVKAEVGKRLEESAWGDKGEERRKNKQKQPHTTLKILTWRGREDSRGSNNSPAHKQTRLCSGMIQEPGSTILLSLITSALVTQALKKQHL